MSTIALTGTGKTYNLTYDDHGNLATKTNAADGSEQTTYTWDARNRLTSIAMGEGGATSIATFKYDALGRRTERVVDQGATVQRTQFVYDGIQAIGELVDGRLSATVLTGLNIDEVIARTVNLAGGAPIDTKSYLTDALGSVLAMTNPTQNPELFYAYSAYGEAGQLGVDLATPANANQYTARENDGLIGGTSVGALYFYRARYYDPVLKRFVSEDPIGLQGGANLYSYVEGSPPNYNDPSGNLIFLVPILANAAIGFAADVAWQTLVEGRSLKCVDWGNAAVAGVASAAFGAGVAGAVRLALRPGGYVIGGMTFFKEGVSKGKYVNHQLFKSGPDPNFRVEWAPKPSWLSGMPHFHPWNPNVHIPIPPVSGAVIGAAVATTSECQCQSQ